MVVSGGPLAAPGPRARRVGWGAGGCTWAGAGAVAGAVARGAPRGHGRGRRDAEAEHTALVQAAVVVVQVAGVDALVGRLQRVDAEREVAARESVGRHGHALVQEARPVGAALPGRVQVEQAVGAVVGHPRRLPVPVRHLLRLLHVPVGPDVRAVHAAQQRGRPERRHQHLLVAVPEGAGGAGCRAGAWGETGPR